MNRGKEVTDTAKSYLIARYIGFYLNANGFENTEENPLVSESEFFSITQTHRLTQNHCRQCP